MGLDDWIEVIFGGALFESAVKIITFNVKGKDGALTFEQLMGTGVNIYNNVLLPIGYSLLVLYFLIELIEKTSHDNFNLEHFLRMFIKLILGTILIQNGITLLSGIRQFGDSIVSSLPKAAANKQVVDSLIKEVEELGFLDKMLMYMQLAVPYAAMLIIKIAIQVTCWSRTIEIIVRTIMAPLALPDIFAEGVRSGGFRYLKKYMAACIQGAIILAIMIVMSSINSALSGVDNIKTFKDLSMGFILDTLVVGFASVTLVIKSREWANDVVGA